MKTIILCGGAGTRLKEETEFKPKPLVSIGDKPILWHIMKIYAHYGYKEFVLALGYKGYMIKDYFVNEKVFVNDFTLDTSNHKIKFHNNECDDFKINFVETGQESLTGERMLRVKPYIADDEFMVTYGDGVIDININKLVKFHRKQGTLATITGVHPHTKYGVVSIDKKTNLVRSFKQKPMMFDYVNGGFMIFNKKAFKYFDKGPMENCLLQLIKMNQLSIYLHEGFWKSMDTYLEMQELNDLWRTKRPWAVWEKRDRKISKETLS